MYSKIQAMKEEGFSIRQISKVIRVSRNTISRYWEMTPDVFVILKMVQKSQITGRKRVHSDILFGYAIVYPEVIGRSA